MKWFVMSLLFFAIQMGQIKAQELESFDMGTALRQMKLDKGDMARMLDQLVQTGQIKAEDAAAAKKELMGMSESDLENVKMKAVNIYEKSSGDPTHLLDEKTLKKLQGLQDLKKER